MGLETGSTISSFITSNPTSSDPVNQGDDHLRLIKSILKAQFPGAAGNGFATAITATEAELNYVHGVTSNIQTQINNFLPSGTRMPFAQAAAPTGWTQDITDNANNRMLRVVNTTGNGIGGTASPILNNTVPSHTHTFTGSFTGAALGTHTHTTPLPTGWSSGGSGGINFHSGSVSGASGYNGVSNAISAGTPSGTISGTNAANASASDWTPRYIDLIICSKN
jgi:hypothetical protein